VSIGKAADRLSKTMLAARDAKPALAVTDRANLFGQ
jgi:hypothetical protein